MVTDDVHIIILNWNNYQDTAACLSSLRQLRFDRFTVILVDNGSTDDSASRIRNEFPWVHQIENGKNLGFAGGCNVGIRYALAHGAGFVWLLNNDALVDSRTLQALVDKAASSVHIAIVGSAIYSTSDPQQLQAWGGGFVNFWLGRSRHYQRAVRDESLEFITGASMLISRTALERFGLLDEGFFMYWEDADYCFRVRQGGLRLAVAGQSRVWHKESASIGKNSAALDAYFNASAARFFKKHALFPFFSFWIGCGLRLAKRALNGDWERTRAVLSGVTQQ